jgi:hypothetical protein
MPNGGGQPSTATTNTAPWSGQQPFLTTGFNYALNHLKGNLPQYYPGSTVATQSPSTVAAQEGIYRQQQAGSPLNDTAANYLQNTMGAGYLGQGSPGAINYERNTLDPSYMNAGSPNSGAVFNDVASHVLPAVASQFSLNGRYGSGAQANAAAEGLANAYAPFAQSLFQGQEANQAQAAQMAQNKFQTQEANQQQAAGMAPNQAQQPYFGLDQLLQSGAAKDTYNQNLVNAGVNQWNFNQNAPANRLQQYMSLIQGGNWGTSGTSTMTQPTSLLSGLGGLIGGIL